MNKPKSLKQQFLEMVKNLNNSRAPQQYVIYGSSETFKQMDKAMEDLVWSLNNPMLGPEQKWHFADGFYKVLKAFGEAKVGDILLFKSYVHSRVVKIATATEKQVFFDYTENMKTGMKFTPEEFQAIQPLTKWEIIKIFPHLSERIKHLYGYHAVMKFYPEKMCTDCWKSMNLELQENRHIGTCSKRCDKCGKHPLVTTWNTSLKPIGL